MYIKSENTSIKMLNTTIITEQNKHWTTGKVNSAYMKEFKRDIYNELNRKLKSPCILILKGLRRTGKTTLLFQVMAHLLKTGTQSKQIMYFSFDQSGVELKEVFEYYGQEVIQDSISNREIYFFLDEIQKLDDWQNKIKTYHDTYPKLKFILTGSANITLAKAKESLAGRINVQDLCPLSFREYLLYKQIRPSRVAESTIKPQLTRYIKKGLFFESIDMDDRELNEFLEHTIIDRILYIDLPSAFDIDDKELLKKIFTIVLGNPGMLLNYQSLSRQLNRDWRTIEKYVSYLTYSMLIRKVYNYSPNELTSEKKLKKAYPTIIRYNPEIIGKIVENIVLLHSNAKFFYRDAQKREVDFILTQPLLPVEVKYRNTIDNSDLKWTKAFINKHKLKKGLIITKETRKKEEGIEFVPFWQWLLDN